MIASEEDDSQPGDTQTVAHSADADSFVPVLNYRSPAAPNGFVTLAHFAASRAPEIVAKLEGARIRAFVVVDQTQADEVEIRVSPNDLGLAIEVAEAPADQFICPRCNNTNLTKLPFPPMARGARLFARCLFVLPVALLLMLGRFDTVSPRQEWKGNIQVLIPPIWLTSFAILQFTTMRIRRRLLCTQCRHEWLPSKDPPITT